MLTKLMLNYPISTNRYYRTYRNITTLSREGKLFKQKVKQKYFHIKPTEIDVKLNIAIHPKQKKNGLTFKQVIDIDNGLKCVLDSLIGIVYYDDKQVKSLCVDYGNPVVGGATTVIVDEWQNAAIN